MQWRTTCTAGCGFFFFFFLLPATWHGCGGGRAMEEREKESAVQIFLGLEISIECIK